MAMLPGKNYRSSVNQVRVLQRVRGLQIQAMLRPVCCLPPVFGVNAGACQAHEGLQELRQTLKDGPGYVTQLQEDWRHGMCLAHCQSMLTYAVPA